MFFRLDLIIDKFGFIFDEVELRQRTFAELFLHQQRLCSCWIEAFIISAFG
jgi:hypothetical protein